MFQCLFYPVLSVSLIIGADNSPHLERLPWAFEASLRMQPTHIRCLKARLIRSLWFWLLWFKINQYVYSGTRIPVCGISKPMISCKKWHRFMWWPTSTWRLHAGLGKAVLDFSWMAGWSRTLPASSPFSSFSWSQTCLLSQGHPSLSDFPSLQDFCKQILKCLGHSWTVLILPLYHLCCRSKGRKPRI